MIVKDYFLVKLKPVVLTASMLLITAGCSSMPLNEYDETINPRENMPGPGILSNAAGESVLKWKSDVSPDSNKSGYQMPDDKDEFELYKDWKKLKSKGENSDEYRDFLQWLEFQKFKAKQ